MSWISEQTYSYQRRDFAGKQFLRYELQMIGACNNLFEAGPFELLYLCLSSCYQSPQVFLLAPDNRSKKSILVLRTDSPTLYKKGLFCQLLPIAFFLLMMEHFVVFYFRN